jgi:putative FmdB family regulatory protein
MPTYDYLCKSCGAATEIFHSMADKPKRKCPECGALKLERQIGAGGGILFKGSGYYQTDYRSEAYNKAAAADKKSSTDSSSSKPASGDKTPKSDSKKKKSKD